MLIHENTQITMAISNTANFVQELKRFDEHVRSLIEKYPSCDNIPEKHFSDLLADIMKDLHESRAENTQPSKQI